MKQDSYLLWIGLSLLFGSWGGYALLDSVRRSGPHAEEYILLGGTLVAVGLVALSFAFEQYSRRRKLARHMGRKRVYRRPRVRRIATGLRQVQSRPAESVAQDDPGRVEQEVLSEAK